MRQVLLPSFRFWFRGPLTLFCLVVKLGAQAFLRTSGVLFVRRSVANSIKGGGIPNCDSSKGERGGEAIFLAPLQSTSVDTNCF